MLKLYYQDGYVCSPMNYIGGKYKLLPQIMPLFPKKIQTFVDLFCGGCNVGINVRAQKVVFNDNLSYLIDLYKTFNTLDINEILSHIESRIVQYNLSKTNEDGYKELRKLYNKERNPLDLFVLVAFSFNHQIRFNNSHEFNNPFGRERSSFNPKMKSNLYTFLKVLQNKSSEFVCFNFDKFDFSVYTNEDFVYCDPPYLITTGTYNDGKRGFTGWNDNEEIKLLNILSQLNDKNIKFGLSNVLTHKGKQNDILVEWVECNNFYVTHLNKNYSNSNYHTSDRNSQNTDEVLITNYQPIQEYSLF
jgi:DNA adenine methylase